MKFKILVIDDEKRIREIFSLVLQEKGYLVETAGTGKEGIIKAKEFLPELVLLDMNLPDSSGIEVLRELKEYSPQTDAIIITAFGTVKNAVEATKFGAYDYLEKPVDNEQLLLVVSRALELKRLQREVEELKSELSARYSFSNIIGSGSRMNSVFQMIGKIARVDGTVLITGESGTGKELVARAIHLNSHRKDGPFVVVNCSAIPNNLIESEFFGHTKGAFTDAKFEKTGKFELANKGTIFLDEVAELSPEAQAKLLRALGEKEIVKVGGTKTISVDVRVIAATNRNLEEAVKRGEFREDLYWRLAVLSINLPPLRERKEDIPLLCDHFIERYNRELKKSIKGISPQALGCLKTYLWPGNIRELESVLYESIVMSENAWVEISDLPKRIRESNLKKNTEMILEEKKAFGETIKDLKERAERAMIIEVLRETHGNRSKAAQRLGISRKSLFNKMKLYGIRSDSSQEIESMKKNQ
jgi:DNA-binding NtrC family response regulator